MYCPSCGSLIAPDAVQCSLCGALVPAPPSVVPRSWERIVTCLLCQRSFNAPRDRTVIYCVFCQAKIETATG